MRRPSPAIAVMVAFALSCFGLLLFLWIAFGGPVPLTPKGYRVTASFTRGRPARDAGRRAHRRRARRAGQVDRARRGDRALARRAASSTPSTRRCPPTRARSCARRRCSARPTWSSRRAPDGAPPVPEGGRLADGRVGETVELDEVLRALDPETRVAFQAWMQTQAEALDGHGRDLNDALGNLAPFAEDAGRLVRRAPPPGRRAAPRRREHRRGVRGADGARRPAARADRERRRRVPAPRRRATARWPPRSWRCRPSRPSRSGPCAGSRASCATRTRSSGSCARRRASSARRCAT